MVPIEPWRNSTPVFCAVDFCTTKIEAFRASLTSPFRSLGWPRSKVSDVMRRRNWGHWGRPAVHNCDAACHHFRPGPPQWHHCGRRVTSLTFDLGHLSNLSGNVKEDLKSSIFVVQKAAAPKTGVEFSQGAIALWFIMCSFHWKNFFSPIRLIIHSFSPPNPA